MRPNFHRWVVLGAAVLGLATGTVCGGTTVSIGELCRGRDMCDGACVTLDSSEKHCGVCGNACPPGVPCSGGVCSSGCSGGLALCGGACVDLGSDAANCGACGATCGPTDRCAGGTCACAALECGGSCVDPQSDPNNCGGCFISCPGGSPCVDGLCEPVCAFGESPCLGSCVDTLLDPANCGACGIVCPAGQKCLEGFCTCGGACGLCAVTQLGVFVPQQISGTTRGALDLLSGSCGLPKSPEVVFSFIAPADGVYDFDTAGSSFDTTLYMLDDGCAELACNDDAGQSTAKLTVPLAGMQTVYVVVDGTNGSQGTFVLSISSL